MRLGFIFWFNICKCLIFSKVVLLVCYHNLLFYIMKFHSVISMKIQIFIKHRINIWSVNMINTITASHHQGICDLEEMCCQGKSRVWTGFNHSWPHCQSSWWGELTQKPRNCFPNILFSNIQLHTIYGIGYRASLICLVCNLWGNLPLVVFVFNCLLQDLWLKQ